MAKAQDRFVNLMSDLFHDGVTDDFVCAGFLGTSSGSPRSADLGALPAPPLPVNLGLGRTLSVFPRSGPVTH